MEEKLEAYRRRKKKEEMIESLKNSLTNTFSWKKKEDPAEDISRLIRHEDIEEVESIESDENEEVPETTENSIFTQVTYLLYFLLWATLYAIAIKYEFGAVYFILSSLVLIWVNTRTGPKKKNEPSAYSVFNPNCEAIDGTLDAEQFEREIRYGIGSMH